MKRNRKYWKSAYRELLDMYTVCENRLEKTMQELRASRERELALQAEIGLLEATLHRLTQQRNNPE